MTTLLPLMVKPYAFEKGTEYPIYSEVTIKTFHSDCSFLQVHNHMEYSTSFDDILLTNAQVTCGPQKLEFSATPFKCTAFESCFHCGKM